MKQQFSYLIESLSISVSSVKIAFNMSKVAFLNNLIREGKGLNKILDKVKFLEASSGNALATFTVTENETNPMGTLHGGFSATLIDVVSSFGLFTHEPWAAPSVSLNINLTYMKAANIGDEILCESKLLRAGKSVAFLECEIRSSKDNSVLVKAMHSKYLLPSKSFK